MNAERRKTTQKLIEMEMEQRYGKRSRVIFALVGPEI